MKVSLTYQIDFDRVPEEIMHFLERAHGDVATTQQSIASMNYSAGLGADFLARVVGLRENLSDIDEQLSSIMSIVSEYEKALIQTHMREDGVEAPEEEAHDEQS